MKTKTVRIAAVVSALAVLTIFVAHCPAVNLHEDHGFVTLMPGDMKWSGPAGGLQSVLLAGDPSKPGPYLMRVKFPPGVMTRPHRHSQDRYVTVISGTWFAGVNDQFTPERTEGLPPGSFMIHPTGAAHYDGAKTEEVIVQISGTGPVATEYIDPAAGPTGRSVP